MTLRTALKNEISAWKFIINSDYCVPPYCLVCWHSQDFCYVIASQPIRLSPQIKKILGQLQDCFRAVLKLISRTSQDIPGTKSFNKEYEITYQDYSWDLSCDFIPGQFLRVPRTVLEISVGIRIPAIRIFVARRVTDFPPASALVTITTSQPAPRENYHLARYKCPDNAHKESI